MENTNYLNPRLVSNRDNSNSVAAVKCENLRLVDNGDGRKVLMVVGQPKRLISGDYEPLAVFNHVNQDDVTAFVKRERTVFVMPLTSGDLTELYTFDSDVLRAFAFNDYVLIVTSGGSFRAVYDAESATWQQPVQEGDYRAVSLCTADAGALQQTIGERKLSKVYNSDYTPSDTDKRNIVSDLVTAYTTLAKAARENDAYIQPALCRYRLRDEQGRELFTSPTVLVGATCGQQMSSPVTIGSDDRQTLDAYSIDVETWQLQLRIADGKMASDDRVATLEVLMSPQFHPYDSSAPAQISFSRRDNSSDFMKLVLPGDALTETVVGRLASRMDGMERVVATVNRPFADGAQTLTITASNPLSMSEEIKAVKAALRREVGRTDSVTARLLPPHRFTAEVAATASGVTLWGNVQAQRYDGYPLGIFAASTLNKPWRAAVKVEFADGSEIAVWQGQSTTGCPDTINPILSYPSVDAIKMTISLATTGQAPLEQTFELTPDETGTCARYIDVSLKPFTLSTSTQAFVIPSANLLTLDLPEVIIATDAAQPQVAQVVKQMDCGAIRAITSARVGQNAWDFGRSRFYVLTERGISSVAINAAHSAMSVNLIDNRGVSCADSVTAADDEVIVAASNGDLLALRSSRITTIRAGAGYRHLAWVASRRELWGIDSSGAVEVVCFDYDKSRYSRTGIAVDNVLNYSGGVLAKTSSGIVNLCQEAMSMAQAVSWSVTISPRKMELFVPELLRTDMAALKFNGTVSMSRVGLTTIAPSPDISAAISGEVRSPIVLRPQTRPMRSLTLTITAEVTADFRLAGVLLKLKS